MGGRVGEGLEEWEGGWEGHYTSSRPPSPALDAPPPPPPRGTPAAPPPPRAVRPPVPRPTPRPRRPRRRRQSPSLLRAPWREHSPAAPATPPALPSPRPALSPPTPHTQRAGAPSLSYQPRAHRGADTETSPHVPRFLPEGGGAWRRRRRGRSLPPNAPLSVGWMEEIPRQGTAGGESRSGVSQEQLLFSLAAVGGRAPCLHTPPAPPPPPPP